MKRDQLLIVENDPFMMRAVELAAARLDLEPVLARDGWDAILKLETSDYVAAVVDAELPEQSGFGVLRYIREEFGERSLDRVLVLTSSDETAGLIGSDRVHLLRRTEQVEELASAIRCCEPAVRDELGAALEEVET